MEKIVIIGGGPSGMMAAISAKKYNNDKEVVLLERNKELARKLMLTGGGRCNVTADVNNEEVIENVVKNGKFLYSSLTNFNTQSIISFFKELDCPLKKEDHNRMFPITNKSIDIVKALEKEMKNRNVRIKNNVLVEDIKVGKKLLKTNIGDIKFDKLIIATGGKTLPQTGSSGIGYELAEKIGHKVTTLIPAEVPLVSNDSYIQEKTLQGLSFNDVTLKIYKKNKIYKEITHDLLFTHFGISGPASLRASFYVLKLLEKQEEVLIKIDFIPNVSIQELEKQEDINGYIKNIGLPKRLIDYILLISKNKNEIINNIKFFEINIYTTRGFKNAFVTNGGINLKEIDPKTMKSKINNDISFCGELLDINAYTGGYNITSAFSTGYTAGKNAYK